MTRALRAWRVACALLLLLFQLTLVPLFVLLMFLGAPWWPPAARYFSGAWCRIVLALGRILCGLRFEVQGWENLPATPCVILVKHQSAWETMFFPAYMPPHAIVLKREILSFPFFGWGMRMLDPIAIDRDARQEAFQQVLTQGLERLAAGLHVIIFPEGTRVPFGFKARYAPGGGLLAVAAGVPVVPMVHNAGQFWGKGLLERRPGLIQVRIGSPIPSTGQNGIAVSRQAEAWIESQLQEMTGVTPRFYTRKHKDTFKNMDGSKDGGKDGGKCMDKSQNSGPGAALKTVAPAQTARAPRRHHCEHRGQNLYYRLVRRRRQRRINLIVDGRGLTVSAPTWVDQLQIQEGIRTQWDWICQQLERWGQHSQDGSSAPLSYSGPATCLPGWGQEAIRAQRQGSGPAFWFGPASLLPWRGGLCRISYRSPQGSLALEPELEQVEVDPSRPVEPQVLKWYRSRALAEFPARAAHFAAQLGLAPPPVSLSNAHTRWGSCNSRGQIRLNWRLIKASSAESDYVIAHEVAHLRHLDHSPAFWATVEQLLPDYRSASTLLKRNDPYYRQF